MAGGLAIKIGVWLVLLLFNCFTEAGLLISKRGNIRNNGKINHFCEVSQNDVNDSLTLKSGSRIYCSQVPGPVLKLDVDQDSYLKYNSSLYITGSEYCALKENPKLGRLCPVRFKPTWTKCCRENEIFDASDFKCRKSRIPYRPKAANSSTYQSFVVAKNFSKVGEHTSSVPLICENGFVPKVYSSNPCLPGSSGIFHLSANGTPVFEASTGVFLRRTQLRPIEYDFYCLDGILDFSLSSSSCITEINEYIDIDRSCLREKMEEVLLVCTKDKDTTRDTDNEDNVPKAYFFATVWLSTCPFLLSSALVNSFIIQKNVHGWILTSYLISMFLVNVNSVILVLDLHVTPSSTLKVEGGCGVLDFTMKFIYLSSLCWMSSMCINMLRTFRQSSTVPKAVEPHRFFLSALFSLGFPLIPVSISYFMGSLPDDISLRKVFEYAWNNSTDAVDSSPSQQKMCHQGTCALYSYKTLPYYSGPIIFLVLCNVISFIKTSTTIASLRRQTEAVLHKQTRDHLESFALFAKLFLLTGSIWVIRVVLLVLQIQGLYVTWYGVVLEAVFSIPEVAFPMIIFHHPEFIKWASHKSPLISRIFIKCSPFCRKKLILRDSATFPDSHIVNQNLQNNMATLCNNLTNHSVRSQPQSLVNIMLDEQGQQVTCTSDATNNIPIPKVTSV